MPVSNPCSVMIGRVLSKDLGGEEGDGVSVHWYTPKRSKNPCRRSVYGRGSWSTDFVYDSNNKRVADSGIESASVACFTFPCLLASGKLPAAVWVALEENVEPPSEAEEEEEEKDKPLANAGGLGAAGSASLELPSGALKVRKTAAAFKPSRHTTRNHVKFRRDRVLHVSLHVCGNCRSHHVLYDFRRSREKCVRPESKQKLRHQRNASCMRSTYGGVHRTSVFCPVHKNTVKRFEAL